jgi:hypothetical protein
MSIEKLDGEVGRGGGIWRWGGEMGFVDGMEGGYKGEFQI